MQAPRVEVEEETEAILEPEVIGEKETGGRVARDPHDRRARQPRGRVRAHASQRRLPRHRSPRRQPASYVLERPGISQGRCRALRRRRPCSCQAPDVHEHLRRVGQAARRALRRGDRGPDRHPRRHRPARPATCASSAAAATAATTASGRSTRSSAATRTCGCEWESAAPRRMDSADYVLQPLRGDGVGRVRGQHPDRRASRAQHPRERRRASHAGLQRGIEPDASPGDAMLRHTRRAAHRAALLRNCAWHPHG